MSNIELWLLAIGLGMDCFTVSVASGIHLRTINWRTFIEMALLFGLFQAAMPILGWFGAQHFSYLIEAYDHWIAFGLLAFLGIKMIHESFKEEEDKNFNPTLLKVMLTLAVATSIDALAVGISFAFLEMETFQSIVWPITAIGIASFVLSLAGNFMGVFFGKRYNLHMELWGGLILIGIGVKILLEHLHA
ncbi:MAG: manganese efflux pump MntP family protein [Phocaeicola sp.]